MASEDLTSSDEEGAFSLSESFTKAFSFQSRSPTPRDLYEGERLNSRVRILILFIRTLSDAAAAWCWKNAIC